MPDEKQKTEMTAEMTPEQRRVWELERRADAASKAGEPLPTLREWLEAAGCDLDRLLLREGVDLDARPGRWGDVPTDPLIGWAPGLVWLVTSSEGEPWPDVWRIEGPSAEELADGLLAQSKVIGRLRGLLRDIEHELRQADPRWPRETCNFERLLERIEAALYLPDVVERIGDALAEGGG